MKKHLHTPGPWKAYSSGFDNPKHEGFSKSWSVGFGEILGWRGPGFLFDMVHPVQHQIFANEQDRKDALLEAEANARLIAAAPEMLEALQNLENDNGKTMPESAWLLVQNAIKKATVK